MNKIRKVYYTFVLKYKKKNIQEHNGSIFRRPHARDPKKRKN
ncbi:hypothetical protein HMPREF1981_02120 [Bacteroides pyogenes F0041]|uniref:Uncharacterized protein n=1 Tax=Bacteroides pyogenes F0041 TaxID=1321819 RepID=U2CL44_9BACE|nr:hypothetical protein HMPREF1981_02120 [Bacteroides pyogenes F0041]MBB3896153.1 hypothetical protein [Bacteroides pyogenes]SUV35955.1 Uncharacterised protein [Bacteroides pyogenes]